MGKNLRKVKHIGRYVLKVIPIPLEHEPRPRLAVKAASVIDRLARPAVGFTEPQDRRAHLLAWLLLFIVVLSAAALLLVVIFNPTSSPRRGLYMLLVIGLIVLAAIAYRLNQTGHYGVSAGLAVALAAIGPWGSAMLDPAVTQGDFVPLTYVVLPVLLASVLLRPSVTTVLAVLQLFVLALVPLVVPAAAAINWPSFVGFVAFTSVLSVAASVVSRRDLAQIDEQTRQLATSEARLRELSVHDPLTNLFNRRYLEATLMREVRRAERENAPLSIIMMDIDHFKRFNDTLGHAAGDALLQDLGGLLSRTIRAADVACRYGGEEFVLVLPHTSLEVATARAELVRAAVKNLHVVRSGLVLGAVSVSLGVAVFPDHGCDGESVLRSADSALYRAKDQGRDQVVVAWGDGRRLGCDLAENTGGVVETGGRHDSTEKV
ncbi:MAG: GGDEF domain-containing protein [Coriobacteriia bacterium]